MLIDAARRAHSAAKEMVAAVDSGSASTAELREALELSRLFMAAGSAFQSAAASVISRAEQHGDGGTQVLADAAGLTRREAHSQVKTAETLQAAPVVREAVAAGKVSSANARRLADVIGKTSAADVAADRNLLAKAETLRPEHFAREARRWVTHHDRGDGEAEHVRQRARRWLRVSDTDDGMVLIRGEFDALTGRQIGNRIRAEAARLHDGDKKAAKAAASSGSIAPPRVSAAQAGSASAVDSHQRRSFAQCMADALDNLTSGAGSDGGKGFADICVVAHLDDATGKLVAETPDGHRLPKAVLERLACNAKFTGVLYDRGGKPIWRATSLRSANESQRQILFAKYGGCFHCAAHPGLCQIHHIKPVAEGGPTSIRNMVPVCWDCHNLIHDHDWWVLQRSDGNHTLHPPDRLRHGPARADDLPPPIFGSGFRAPLDQHRQSRFEDIPDTPRL